MYKYNLLTTSAFEVGSRWERGYGLGALLNDEKAPTSCLQRLDALEANVQVQLIKHPAASKSGPDGNKTPNSTMSP